VLDASNEDEGRETLQNQINEVLKSDQ